MTDIKKLRLKSTEGKAIELLDFLEMLMNPKMRKLLRKNFLLVLLKKWVIVHTVHLGIEKP